MLLEKQFELALDLVTEKPDIQVGSFEVSSMKEAKLEFIESKNMTDYFSLKYQISGSKTPDGAVPYIPPEVRPLESDLLDIAIGGGPGRRQVLAEREGEHSQSRQRGLLE
jgi:hypothetical protein